MSLLVDFKQQPLVLFYRQLSPKSHANIYNLEGIILDQNNKMSDFYIKVNFIEKFFFAKNLLKII